MRYSLKLSDNNERPQNVEDQKVEQTTSIPTIQEERGSNSSSIITSIDFSTPNGGSIHQ
jgi:hypothetical protein